ncbi:MAG TPA: hypothetical protein VMK84_10505 [Streptosporangiaceae bacterium]|nr:hypothetical protein [Streptosporangiaceae bacterium]
MTTAEQRPGTPRAGVPLWWPRRPGNGGRSCQPPGASGPGAWPYYERAVELARGTGAVGKLPDALNGAAFAAAETGKWLQALALGSQALGLAQATVQERLVCDALVTLASVEAAQGRRDDCLRHVHEADRLASDLACA